MSKFLLINILILSQIVTACNFLDLSQLSIQFNPSVNYSTITSNDSISLTFNQDIIQTDVEDLITLKSHTYGAVQFDTDWNDNTITISPLEELLPGVCYTISCEGQIETKDNLHFNIDQKLHFYYETSSIPPLMIGHIPENDSIIDIYTPLIINFSSPMSLDYPDKYISIYPQTDFNISSNEENTMIVLTPKKQWTGLTRYKWTISEDFSNYENIKLRKSYTGYFRTYNDIAQLNPPVIIGYHLNNDTTTPIGNIDNDYGILFQFDRIMNMDSIIENIEITPSIKLSTRIINQYKLLVFPELKKWTPETSFNCSIKSGIKDIYENVSIIDYVFEFTPKIQYLSVDKISDKDSDFSTFNTTTPYKILINELSSSHYFSLSFNQPFSSKEAEVLLQAISFTPIFPYYAENPEIVFFSHNTLNPNEITIKYKGITTSQSKMSQETVYYRLAIKGGENSIALRNGSYIKEDIELIFITEGE